MWGCEALKSDHEVTLVTLGDVDLEALNQFYGTSIKRNEVAIRRPVFLPSCIRNMKVADAIRVYLFHRFARNVAADFDVLVSAYNPVDFGVPGIHFIGDFTWDPALRDEFDPPPPGATKGIHSRSWLRKAYLWLARLLGNPSGRDLFAGDDEIVANSRWSARLLEDRYGIRSSVVYPPVLGEFPEVSSAEREFGAVCIGRISPEKRIDRVIDIVKGVRERGHPLHLHIIGDATGSEYGEQIMARATGEGDWVTMEGSCHGERKARLLAEHLIGLQAREHEPFGISVAEMVKAGCLTFVHDSGGQTEIVDHPDLCYESVEDAVEKICWVLEDKKLQSELQEHLVTRATRFSSAQFMQEVQSVVKSFLEKSAEKDGS